MAKKVFRPRWWAVVLTVLLSGAMVALGIWQIERGQAKQALLDRYAAAEQSTPRPITAGSWAEKGVIVRAETKGSFDGSMQLLLDNQTHDGVPGYHVWTPLKLETGGMVMVDRGWVPADGDRSKLPQIDAPTGEVTVSGYWRTPPEPGMRVDVDNCGGGPWPRVVEYPTIDDLRCLYGEFVASGILLMDAKLPGGYVRDWAGAPELQPRKHYGYAAQWFMFTLVLLFFFFKLSFRPKT